MGLFANIKTKIKKTAKHKLFKKLNKNISRVVKQENKAHTLDEDIKKLNSIKKNSLNRSDSMKAKFRGEAAVGNLEVPTNTVVSTITDLNVISIYPAVAVSQRLSISNPEEFKEDVVSDIVGLSGKSEDVIALATVVAAQYACQDVVEKIKEGMTGTVNTILNGIQAKLK